MLLNQLDFIFNNIDTIINLILMIAIPLIILRILTRAFNHISDNTRIEESSVKTLIRITRYIIFIIIGLGVLDILGINLRSLFVSLGLVTVAVSLAAKDTLSNIISGIMIVVEKRFQVGDVIEIDGKRGQVKKIGFKSVQLFSRNEYTVIPNILFTTKSFVNFTKTGYYIVPFTIYLLNSYDIDEKLSEIEKILDNSDLILKDPKYSIFVKSITTSGVEVLIKVPVANPLDDSKVVSDLIREFKRNIEFEDIT